jgi:hypothetical protein
MGKLGILYVFLFVMLGCTAEMPDAEPSPDLLAELSAYFPLEEGIYRDYRSIRTTNFTATDVQTVNFFTRELLAFPELNQTGVVTYELRRSVRSQQAQPWTLDSLWSVRVEEQPFPRLVQVENGLPFIKMVSPVREGQLWDGNGLNGLPREDYSYIERVPQYTVNGETFTDCLIVSHLDDDDEITVREVRFEVYARGKGMVHRYVAKQRYCSRPECLGQKIIEQGFVLEMTQIGHGRN